MSTIPETLVAPPVSSVEEVQNAVASPTPSSPAFMRAPRADLWAFLAATTRDRGLADDLAQETYLRFLQVRATLAGEEDRRRYLFRIASNLLHDHWRRLRRSPPPTPLDDAEAGDEPAAGDKPADPTTRLDVAAALGRLSPRERELVWLAHVEGLAHRELAERVGLRPASVRVLLFRARRRMADWLGGRA